MVAKKGRKGVSRKVKNDFTKVTSTPDCPPLSATATAKQIEVLSLINDEGLNQSAISRRLNVSRNAIKDRVNWLLNKGLLSKDYHTLSLTNLGKEALNKVKGGVAGSVKKKSVHANVFECPLLGLPNGWNKGNLFFQSLKAKDFHNNNSTKTAFFYFDECTVRIFYGVSQKVMFDIKDQVGRSFDEIESRVWDKFVEFFRVVEANGFKLGRDVSNQNPHFADPNGFFAKLSDKFTSKGFRIRCDDIDFWVDYSNGYAEEETDEKEVAEYMETLANSAVRTRLTFADVEKQGEHLDKLSKIVTTLVEIQARQIVPPKVETFDLKEANYFG